jgi:pSer/pThr/pTyr-binding forkhead associated (FHA) protein
MPEREATPGTNLLNPSWKLVFKLGNDTVSLPVGNPIVVGRVADSSEKDQVQLDLAAHGGFQGGVSRKHATITFHEGALYIEDLGSTNGTRINGFQLTPNRKYRLRDGDEVEFARLRVGVRFMRP